MIDTLLLGILLVVTGCRIDGDKEVDRSGFTFRTGDDTELFFKNIRQSDYDLETNEAAGFNVFRHEDRPRDEKLPWLNPAIVINYRQDEAYILMEPSAVLADMERWEIVHSTDTIRLETPNREANLEFATRIYEHLKTGDTLMILTESGYEEFPVSREHAESFRITMSDYYRLTRIF